jgi:hypothetical protein
MYVVANAYAFKEAEKFKFFAVLIETSDKSPLGQGKYYIQVDSRQNKSSGRITSTPPTDAFSRCGSFQQEPVNEYQRVILCPRNRFDNVKDSKEILRLRSRNRLWIGYEDHYSAPENAGAPKRTTHDGLRTYKITIYLMGDQSVSSNGERSWGRVIASLSITNDGYFNTDPEIGEPWHKGFTRVFILGLCVQYNADELSAQDPRGIRFHLQCPMSAFPKVPADDFPFALPPPRFLGKRPFYPDDLNSPTAEIAGTGTNYADRFGGLEQEQRAFIPTRWNFKAPHDSNSGRISIHNLIHPVSVIPPRDRAAASGYLHGDKKLSSQSLPFITLTETCFTLSNVKSEKDRVLDPSALCDHVGHDSKSTTSSDHLSDNVVFEHADDAVERGSHMESLSRARSGRGADGTLSSNFYLRAPSENGLGKRCKEVG